MIDRATTIDTPYYEGPAGILISTVDILPTELGKQNLGLLLISAKDASEHFSKCLLPYIRHLTKTSASDKSIQETLDRASIVKAGTLTTDHQWLQEGVDSFRAIGDTTKSNTGAASILKKRRVLLLGSGLVAGPAVEVFAGRKDVHLVIGKRPGTSDLDLTRQPVTT